MGMGWDPAGRASPDGKGRSSPQGVAAGSKPIEDWFDFPPCRSRVGAGALKRGEQFTVEHDVA